MDVICYSNYFVPNTMMYYAQDASFLLEQSICLVLCLSIRFVKTISINECSENIAVCMSVWRISVEIWHSMDLRRARASFPGKVIFSHEPSYWKVLMGVIEPC
jgi:hypothetical protein